MRFLPLLPGRNGEKVAKMLRNLSVKRGNAVSTRRKRPTWTSTRGCADLRQFMEAVVIGVHRPIGEEQFR